MSMLTKGSLCPYCHIEPYVMKDSESYLYHLITDHDYPVESDFEYVKGRFKNLGIILNLEKSEKIG